MLNVVLLSPVWLSAPQRRERRGEEENNNSNNKKEEYQLQQKAANKQTKSRKLIFNRNKMAGREKERNFNQRNANFTN